MPKYLGGGTGGGPPPPPAVISVFARIGAVVATLGDYAASLITNDSTVSGATVKDALNTLKAASGVSSVFARTGAVVAVLNDYAASLIANDSSVTGATVKDALNTLGGASGVTSVFTRTGAVVAVLGDYAASKISNDSSISGTTVKDALNNIGSFLSGLVTGVSSVFGRTGAVVAVAGDYTGAQVTDTSNLPGTYVTDALNYLGQATAAVAGGATPSLPFGTNRYQVLTLSANATPTVTVPPAGLEAILEVVQPSSGGPYTITWPSSVRWTDGVAPVLSTGASKRDIIRFMSNGSQLLGWAQSLNLSA